MLLPLHRQVSSPLSLRLRSSYVRWRRLQPASLYTRSGQGGKGNEHKNRGHGLRCSGSDRTEDLDNISASLQQSLDLVKGPIVAGVVVTLER